jgi:hypothetical protein
MRKLLGCCKKLDTDRWQRELEWERSKINHEEGDNMLLRENGVHGKDFVVS